MMKSPLRLSHACRQASLKALFAARVFGVVSVFGAMGVLSGMAAALAAGTGQAHQVVAAAVARGDKAQAGGRRALDCGIGPLTSDAPSAATQAVSQPQSDVVDQSGGRIVDDGGTRKYIPGGSSRYVYTLPSSSGPAGDAAVPGGGAVDHLDPGKGNGGKKNSGKTSPGAAKAGLIAEIEGPARDAGTKGGLGGTVYIVTDARDYHPTKADAIPGTLRHAIDAARRANAPAWITVHPSLAGKTVPLTAPLRPTSNMTLDATCAGLVLEGAPELTLMAVRDVRNLVVAGFFFRKTVYSGENKGRDDGKDFRDCVTIAGNVDGIAFLHNNFGACGDGQIDITTGARQAMPKAGGRITIAYNRFSKHDKAMLIGSYGCQDFSKTLTQGCALPSGSPALAPVYRVALHGNLFQWTGQRNPRIFGRVEVHLTNNIFAFEPYDRGNGTQGASYGQYVANGARVLSEHNVYVGIGHGGKPPMGLFTVSTPQASPSPGDSDGVITAHGNLRFGREVIEDRGASAASVRTLMEAGQVLALEPLGVPGAIACIAARAGTAGGTSWSPMLCRR